MTLLALMGLVTGLGLTATWLLGLAGPRATVRHGRRHPRDNPKRDLP